MRISIYTILCLVSPIVVASSVLVPKPSWLDSVRGFTHFYLIQALSPSRKGLLASRLSVFWGSSTVLGLNVSGSAKSFEERIEDQECTLTVVFPLNQHFSSPPPSRGWCGRGGKGARFLPHLTSGDNQTIAIGRHVPLRQPPSFFSSKMEEQKSFLPSHLSPLSMRLKILAFEDMTWVVVATRTERGIVWA